MAKKIQSTNHPMEELLKKSNSTSTKKGEYTQAKIVSLQRKKVTFDIGSKSFAVLGDQEIKELATYMPYLKEGIEVPVRIIAEESREGYPVVSLRTFFEKGKWDILKAKKESEEDIEVVCGESGKGGVFIEFMGIRGVIPKIQLSSDFVTGSTKMFGQKVKVKVLESDPEKNRLVVSQKAATLNISQKQVKEAFDAIVVGSTHEAKVLGVSEFGIFCEVSSIEGLVHISEISWEKVSDASSFAKIGDAIKVFVTEKNERDMKLNLSLKRLTEDPWQNAEEKFAKDKEFNGTVIRKERYGYFVKLDAGVEGLIHISKIGPSDNLEIGKEVKIYIEKVDKKERRISLILTQNEKPVFYR
jgi:small subunit ribosomal protein S1